MREKNQQATASDPPLGAAGFLSAVDKPSAQCFSQTSTGIQ